MKNFDIWNTQKKEIEGKKCNKTIKTRDIVFIKMGLNVGFEQDGKGEEFLRPVLIYRKFSNNLFLGSPLTSKQKEGIFYHSFAFQDKTSTAIFSQIRLFDSQRMTYCMGRIGSGAFRKLKKKLIELLQ